MKMGPKIKATTARTTVEITKFITSMVSPVGTAYARVTRSNG
jgi:hypothetical protein